MRGRTMRNRSLFVAAVLHALAWSPAYAQDAPQYRTGEIIRARTMLCMDRADVDTFIQNSNEYGTYVAISLMNQDTCGVYEARMAHGAIYEEFASRESDDLDAPRGCTIVRWNHVTVYGRDGRGRPAYALENTGVEAECVPPTRAQPH